MGELVEPTLTEPTFVIDYPKVISPLAKMHRSGDPNLVERFELFIGGDEFANSFSELNDPIDQRKRLEEQSFFKKQGDQEAQNLDENFIQAMECECLPLEVLDWHRSPCNVAYRNRFYKRCYIISCFKIRN